MAPGVYYGWAQVDSNMVYKMVANIGWCPFYENKEMSVVSCSNLYNLDIFAEIILIQVYECFVQIDIKASC